MTHSDRFRRTAALLLTAAVMLAVLAVPAAAAGAGDFGDVSGGAWYYDAVDFVSRKGLFQGTGSGVFSPEGTMTRAMFVTAMGRYAGVDPATWCVGSVNGSDVNLRSGPGTDHAAAATLSNGTALAILGKSGDWYQVSTGSASGYIRGDYVSLRYHAFSDAAFGSYYAGYAAWAYEKGIIQGNGSSATFSPDQNITREQACTILSRFASAMGASLSASGSAGGFTDDGSISSWARDSVYALSRAGIVQGRETGAFDPQGYISRAEASALIQRFDKSVGGFTAPPGQQGTTPPTTSPDQKEENTAPPAASPGQQENTTPPTGNTTPPGQEEPAGLLANAALVDHLSQGDRYCCLATCFSMAANVILGRNEYGPFDWTASDTEDYLNVPAGTSFKGTDGRTYGPVWGSSTSAAGLSSAISSALGKGLPVIASVRNSSTAGTHYVLVIGWTDSSHSEFLIADPSGGGGNLLESAMPMSAKNYSLGNKDGTFVYIQFA